MAFFGIKAQEHALAGLADKLDGFLKTSRFEKSGDWTWERKAGWKVDEVALTVKGGFAKHILPSLRVRLPLMRPSPFGETQHYIAQVNVPRLLRPQSGPEFDVKVPSTWIRRNGFIRAVSADIEAAVPWFDEFKTPRDAKKNLAKYLKPGSLAYDQAMQFLNSLDDRR